MCKKTLPTNSLKTLGETLELQEFYISRDKVDNIRIMDSRFHEQMYLFSGSTVFYDTLFFRCTAKTQKYRRTSVANHGNAEVSLLEHTKIFEAIKSHNEAAAEKKPRQSTLKNAQKRILLKEDILKWDLQLRKKILKKITWFRESLKPAAKYLFVSTRHSLRTQPAQWLTLNLKQWV